MFDDSYPPLTVLLRIRVFFHLLINIRRHDFRSARTFTIMKYPNDPSIIKFIKFFRWALKHMWCEIPDAMRHTRFDDKVSKVPFWLKDGNPLENYPWVKNMDTKLTETADSVVIGCGLGGCAVAYHWGRKSPSNRKLIALDMWDPASGSAGRNEGLVVMGRYF